MFQIFNYLKFTSILFKHLLFFNILKKKNQLNVIKHNNSFGNMYIYIKKKKNYKYIEKKKFFLLKYVDEFYINNSFLNFYVFYIKLFNKNHYYIKSQNILNPLLFWYKKIKILTTGLLFFFNKYYKVTAKQLIFFIKYNLISYFFSQRIHLINYFFLVPLIWSFKSFFFLDTYKYLKKYPKYVIFFLPKIYKQYLILYIFKYNYLGLYKIINFLNIYDINHLNSIFFYNFFNIKIINFFYNFYNIKLYNWGVIN